MLEERNEQAPMSEDYPLMAFIANQGVTQKGERYDRSALVNDETGKKYKRTEFGDFIYSSNNLETGSIGLNNTEMLVFHQFIAYLSQQEKLNWISLDEDFLEKIL